MLRTIEYFVQARPGLTVAKRSGILVTSSGPYHTGLRKRIDRIPLANLALKGARPALHVAVASGPQVAFERAAIQALGGPPTTPADAVGHRRIALAGNVATVTVGLLAQRVLNHGRRQGPIADFGRAMGTHLAIGGTAGAIVVGTDALLGDRGRAAIQAPAAAVTVGAAIAAAQSLLLKQAAKRMAMPQSAYTTRVPVATPRGIHYMPVMPR